MKKIEKLDDGRPCGADSITGSGDNTLASFMRETRAKLNEIIDILNEKEAS